MEFLQDICYAVIIAAVPVLTVYLCKFLSTKWNEIKSTIQNDKLQKTLDMVVETVTNVVTQTNQTFVDSLKNTGTFTSEAAVQAFNMSKETALKLLSEDAKKVIAEIYGDLDTYLDMLIESKVKQLKQ